MSALSLAAFAQQPSCTQREIPVTVIGTDRLPITGLPTSSFKAKVHGQDATIVSVSANQRPPAVELLLDTSADMRRIPKGWLLDGAEYLLSQLPSTVTVGLATFSDKLTPMVAPTLDHGAIRSHLETLRDKEKAQALFSGNPELWNALRGSPPLLEKSQSGDVIYLITTSHTWIGHSSSDDATDALLNAGIRLYGIIYRPLPRELYLRNVLPRPFDEIILTGGTGLVIPSYQPTVIVLAPPQPYVSRNSPNEQDTIKNQIQRSVPQITNFYDVVLGLSQQLDKRQSLEITVTRTDQDKAPFFWHYPHKLVPCSPPATP